MNISALRHIGDQARDVIESVRSAVSNKLGVELRETQIKAAGRLLQRCIVEMQTGEGKTLTTAIAACVTASASVKHQSVLIATANDYLAERDTQWMRPIYQQIGLDVECVTSASTPEHRQQAYQAKVVYGTLREFAFDFLRHSLACRDAPSPAEKTPFPLETLIVDEADSVLIDEARSPMIITAPIGRISEAMEACYQWCAEFASHFRVTIDFIRLVDTGAVALTAQGRRRVSGASMPTTMNSLTTTDIIHALERAIWINESIRRDEHYVLDDGQIHLVDEYTGRKATGKNFGGGIHQAVQARERVELTPDAQPIARITVQEFVNQFRHVSGLTATAWEDRRELRAVFDLDVYPVAPHRPIIRRLLEPVVCPTCQDKWDRICQETISLIGQGRAVLIGTRTIEHSEQLSEVFDGASIQHVVLNARNHRQEADIVSDAGQSGSVTIATNMAGRGTDIRLDPLVNDAGGLHVMVSEPHAAARIDRQLIGRSGRQGDRGTARIYASPEDQILLQAFGHDRAQQICAAAQAGASDRWLWAKLRQAQQRVARQHRKERERLSASEASLALAMKSLGLDPHLDPLPDSR